MGHAVKVRCEICHNNEIDFEAAHRRAHCIRTLLPLHRFTAFDFDSQRYSLTILDGGFVESVKSTGAPPFCRLGQLGFVASFSRFFSLRRLRQVGPAYTIRIWCTARFSGVASTERHAGDECLRRESQVRRDCLPLSGNPGSRQILRLGAIVAKMPPERLLELLDSFQHVEVLQEK